MSVHDQPRIRTDQQQSLKTNLPSMYESSPGWKKFSCSGTSRPSAMWYTVSFTVPCRFLTQHLQKE